jgi:cytochrome c553
MACACLLAAAALPALAQPAPASPVTDPMARRMQACIPCHGREGRATAEGYFPRIAGKPAGYLFNQLVHFRDGRRVNAAMGYLVQHLSDDYLREIAEWFSRQELPYPPPAAVRGDAALLARGERLVREGDPARRLPACAACHGEALTGVQPAMPGLLGLPPDYIAAQVGAWRSKQRRAAEPDCMAEVALRMTGEDVAAAAAWLSAQPVPSGGRPAAASAAPLPLRCGSLP